MTQEPLFGPEPEVPAEPEALPPVPKDVDRKAAPLALLRGKARPCESCGTSIVFAISLKRLRGADRVRVMPVDVAPTPGGNVRLTVDGRRIMAYVIPKAQTRDRADLHMSHFATCPQADQWRSKGGKR